MAGRENEVGHKSVGVPGALPAWTALLRERGRLPLAEVLAPAVRYAGEGFTVSPYLAQAIRGSATDLARFPASAAVFLPGGAPLEAGGRLVRRDYAATLERIGAEGPAAFTEGAIAEAVAADMERNGGLITVEDLARYRAPAPGGGAGHLPGLRDRLRRPRLQRGDAPGAVPQHPGAVRRRRARASAPPPACTCWPRR